MGRVFFLAPITQPAHSWLVGLVNFRCATRLARAVMMTFPPVANLMGFMHITKRVLVGSMVSPICLSSTKESMANCVRGEAPLTSSRTITPVPALMQRFAARSVTSMTMPSGVECGMPPRSSGCFGPM